MANKKETTSKRRPARRAGRVTKPTGAAKLRHVGFYIDKTVYREAVKALGLDAETVSEFLIEQLTRKAKDAGGRVRKVTELELARRLGKNRATVAAMRARGDFDDLYEEKSNGRIVYDLAAALQRANA